MIKDPELLRMAVKAIEAEPERWDQEFWAKGAPAEDADLIPVRMRSHRLNMRPIDVERCGTTMCLAGHIVNQAGIPMLTTLTAEDDNQAIAHCLDQDGFARSISNVAGDLLGLSPQERTFLFGSMTDDIDEFKKLITQVTGVTFE
jgi:hypothetical protein